MDSDLMLWELFRNISCTLHITEYFFEQVLYCIEDEQLRDEPLSGSTDDLDDYTSLDHIYTYDQPETRDVLGALHQTIKDYSAANGYDR